MSNRIFLKYCLEARRHWARRHHRTSPKICRTALVVVAGGTNGMQAWWRAVCGGNRATAFLRQAGYNTVGKLFKLVTSSDSAKSRRRKTHFAKGGSRLRRRLQDTTADCSGVTVAGTEHYRGNGRRLGRLVKDFELAAKITSLCIMIQAAFEELRVSTELIVVWKHLTCQ